MELQQAANGEDIAVVFGKERNVFMLYCIQYKVSIFGNTSAKIVKQCD